MAIIALMPVGLVKVRSGRRGSGWAVGETGVLTSRHVVEPFLYGQAGKCWAVLDPSPEGPGFACEVVFDDAERDLALLKVLDADVPLWQLRLGTQRTTLAEPGRRAMHVEVIGFPDVALDHHGTPNPEAAEAVLMPPGGAVSGRMPLDVDGSVPDAALAWRGMSGAGVRDGKGRLLGIVVEVAKDRQQRRMYAAVLPDPDVDGAFAAALRLVGGPRYLEDANAPRARQLLQFTDPKGRPYKPLQVTGLDSLGVRFSRTDIDTRGDPFYPYIAREVDSELAGALDDRVAGTDPRMLVLVGDAMAGKSRSLAEAVRRHPVVSTWPLLRPTIGASLEDAVGLTEAAEAIVWLDDLDEYLPWLTVDQLRRLLQRPRLAFLATIRSDRLANLAGPDFRAAWDIVTDDTLRQNISLPMTWTENEQLQLQDREQVLHDALNGGKSLGEALGAAHEMVRRLENAPSDLYKALADLITDWPSTGIPTALPDAEAMWLWGSYLSAARGRWLAGLSAEDLMMQYEEVRDWLCQPVAGPGTAIAHRQNSGLVIEGFFQQKRSRDRVELPREIFERALIAAARGSEPESVMLTIAYQAAAAGWESIATQVLDPLAAAGNQEAINIRRTISLLIKNPARIYIQMPDTVRAGTTITPLVIGRMIRAADVEGARVYVDCIIKHKYMGVGIRTYKSKGQTRVIPWPEEKTAKTRLRVGAREFLTPGRFPAGHAFSEMTRIAIPEDAIGWVRTANVEATWEVAAELLTKGRNSRCAIPITIIPGVKQAAARTEIPDDTIATLAFLGIPEGPIFSGEALNGALLVQAKQDLVSYTVTIELILQSTVHRATGSTKTVKYKIYTECLDLHVGQSARISFAGIVPADLPAASIQAYDVGRPAEGLTGVQRLDDFIGVIPNLRSESRSKKIQFSTNWYLEGRVHRRLASGAVIRSHITIARERPDLSGPTDDRRNTGHVRRRSERRGVLGRRLASLATVTSPELQSNNLAEILNELFAFDGLSVKDAFTAGEEYSETRKEINGLVELHGQLYLVQVQLRDEPLDVRDIAGYLVRLHGRDDMHGLIISTSGYKETAIEECKRALRSRTVVMAKTEELILLLEENGSIKTLLEAKLHAATVDNNPFYFLAATRHL